MTKKEYFVVNESAGTISAVYNSAADELEIGKARSTTYGQGMYGSSLTIGSKDLDKLIELLQKVKAQL